MDVNEIIGYFLAGLVGVSLGLMGSGGSILTVPILVYVMGISPVLATAYSLFIVGITALTGTIKNIIDQKIDFKKVLLFGIPSVISVFLTRLFVVPNIPENLFEIGSITITKPTFIMVLFGILMVLAAVSMLRTSKENTSANANISYPILILLGTAIGFVAGLVGAGGGFLIIPALVIIAKTPMKTAAGTSLCIVAIQSLIGFTGDLQTNPDMDWKFLLQFALIAVIGIFVGLALSKKIPGAKLKKGFGWFVIVIAAYIFAKEFFIQ